jgi:hypothetical protein
MIKNYFLTLIITLITSVAFGQVIITEITDPNNEAGARYVELYVIGPSSVDFTDWELIRYTNDNTTISSNTVDLSSLGTLPIGNFAVIAANGTTFQTVYSLAADISAGTGGPADSNGDDKIGIRDNTGTIIDVFGTPGVSSNNTNDAHNFEDGRAERKASVTGPTATWNEAEWNTDNDQGFGSGAQDAPAGYDPKAWIGTSTSTDPTLTISSPTDGAVLDATTSVDVNVSTSNFVVGALNGSGVDGHIHWTLQQNSDAAVNQPMKHDTNDESITVAPGNSYTIYMELVDNTHTAITPAVNKTVTFSVAHPCDFVLGAITATCDAITSGTDTYSGTIAFTGGNNGTAYTITAPAGVIVGGDNPDTSAAGTITFTGMTEGTDIIINIKGDATSSCDLYVDLVSPACLSLPVADDFTYPDGSLTDNPLWVNNGGTIGDLMVVSGQALIQHGTPSEDANLEFIPVAGNIYYALDFTVVDPGSPISGTDTEYFAHFKDTGFGLRARLDIVSPSAVGDFSVGISTKGSTADATWATDLSYGTSYRATVKYDQDNNIAQLWIDAAVEGDISILGTDEADPGDSMVAFGLRQSDSELNEGVLVDNLRIATTFTATTLSVERNSIEGFATYPNPVTNNRFTITSNSSNKKELTIFNVLGKKVLSSSFFGVKSNIDVSTISSGIYIMKVIEGDKVTTKKLIIK